MSVNDIGRDYLEQWYSFRIAEWARTGGGGEWTERRTCGEVGGGRVYGERTQEWCEWWCENGVSALRGGGGGAGVVMILPSPIS